uniref:Uncharacterized protein n=1 Tax=Ditylum brightwellii TaxID=49249 RepID=A0A7S1YTE9_9STRA
MVDTCRFIPEEVDCCCECFFIASCVAFVQLALKLCTGNFFRINQGDVTTQRAITFIIIPIPLPLPLPPLHMNMTVATRPRWQRTQLQRHYKLGNGNGNGSADINIWGGEPGMPKTMEADEDEDEEEEEEELELERGREDDESLVVGLEPT